MARARALSARSLSSFLQVREKENFQHAPHGIIPSLCEHALNAKKGKAEKSKNCEHSITDQSRSSFILHLPVFFFVLEVDLGEPLERCWPTQCPVCLID